MSPASTAAEPAVPTSQELLRAALARTHRRHLWVARRRLWWRWGLWSLGMALRWLLPPLLLATAVGWWLQWPAGWFPSRADATVSPPSRSVTVPASAPAPAESAESAGGLLLRLDAESPQTRPRPRPSAYTQLPSRSAPAPSAPPSQESQ